MLKKAKKAGRKLMRKLGIGKKKKKGKEENDPDKQAKLDKGISDLNTEEKKHLKDGKITREGAEKSAQTIKQKHSVFKTFKVVDGEETWDYKYSASPEVTVEGEKKDDDEKIRIKRKTINFDALKLEGKVWEEKSVELKRQLANQESAINKMQVETWVERRNTFIAKETENDNNQTIRNRIKRDLTNSWMNLYEDRLLAKGYTDSKIDSMANKFANSLTDGEYFRILHNPDRVAGGKAKLDYQAGTISVSQSDKVIISDVFRQLKIIGDNKVNGHIGGQWKTRVPLLHEHVLPIYNSDKFKENKAKLQMSVTLKIVR